MQRRHYLRTCFGVGAATGIAGCTDLGLVETREIPSTPPVLDDRPDTVYFPTHVDGMEMVGMAQDDGGDYAVALAYTYPHRFWRVDATTTSAEDATFHDFDGSQDVHLMALVWDPETGTTLPEAGVTVDIELDGDPLDEQVIYPMLSARMGFHYGANFRLEGDGDYEVTVSIGGANIRRSGAYRGRFEASTSVTVPFEYSAAERDEIPFERTPERAGDHDAPPVMEMEMPLGIAPEPDALPGEYHGTAESDDAQIAVVTLEEPPKGIEGEGPYLAVSARTPHNRLVLPSMELRAQLERAGDTVVETDLKRTFDDRLEYHYGAAIGTAEAGDELTIKVRTHPQVARHEGFETAFLQMSDAELTL